MWKVDMKRRGGRKQWLDSAAVMRHEANRLERMSYTVQVVNEIERVHLQCLELVEFDHDKINRAAACR